MRNRRPFLILLLLFVLPACQVNKDRAPATATKQATAQVFTPVPVETVTAPEAASQLATADS